MIDDYDNEDSHEAGAVFDPGFKLMDRDLARQQARLDQATEKLRNLRPVITFICDQGIDKAIEAFGMEKLKPVINCLAAAWVATTIATAAREQIEHLEWQAQGLDVKPLDEWEGGESHQG